MSQDSFSSPPQVESELARTPRTGYRLLRGLAFLLLLVIALALSYGAVAYAAWQRGQVIRAERAQTDLQQQMQRQMALANSDVAAGNYALAVRRLDWVLEHDPDQPGAYELRHEAHQALNRLLAPPATVVITVIAPPAALEAVGTRLPAEEDAAAALASVRSLMEDETWERAIDALIDFQGRFPNYERRLTDQMLYDTFIRHGVEMLYGDQVELGLHYLERAERLGDLPESVEDQRVWAKLYLQGMAFYGVNWPASIYYFRDLCRAAPFFHNACDRLRMALITYGDQYVLDQEWCPAVPLYSEANQQRHDAVLAGKLVQAREGCLSATPTPLPEEEYEGHNGSEGLPEEGNDTRPQLP
jgi:tetratricopeptide (TPR) repeat protein